jgi:hypothetical protein
VPACLFVCCGWGAVEARTAEPLIDMTMMRIRGVWTTNLTAFLLGAGMYSSFVVFPQFAQLPKSTGFGFGASIVVSGLYLLPSTVGMLFLRCTSRPRQPGHRSRSLGRRLAGPQDEEHENERNDHAPAVELALAGLAEDEEDERRVEEVLASGHVGMIRGERRRGIGAWVESRVDLDLNPRVGADHVPLALCQLGRQE